MLRPQPLPPVPEETARVARAALSPPHPYIKLADELGALFTDECFADLFPTHGQPALAPWRLALATILQFAEGLCDRQAAQAIRSRIDWKYVPRLPLDDPGFDASVLSEFRGRLLAHDATTRLFDILLLWCRERGLIRARGRQRTDSTYVWSAVRGLNRLELVIETMRHALNTLAAADPAWLRQVPAAAMLRLVWLQNYTRTDAEVRWRTEQEIPPAARFINSPYDEDVHLAFRRTMHWIGYQIHLTEACDDDQPPLIIQVETSAATTADGDVTPIIHAALKEDQLLPQEHVVDTGYLDAALLVSSCREYGVDLVGPTRLDYHWQAQERTGFALEHFQIDWDKQQAICPEGHMSNSWTPAVDRRDNRVIKVKFSGQDCRRCPSRELCTRSMKKYPRRTITIRAREEFDALLAARQRVRTGEYARTYAKRAGCEGTLSRGVRRCRLRRTRYIGEERVHLGHLLTATGLNFVRLGEWLAGTPRAKTRSSPFATLMAGSPPA